MSHILLAALSALLFPHLVADSGIAYSNSVFPLLVFAAVFFLLRRAGALPPSRRRSILSHLLGGLFSLMTALGYALEGAGAVPYASLPLWLSAAVYAHVIAQLLSLLWVFLESHEPALARQENTVGPAPRLCRLLGALLARKRRIFALLLLFWAPCYLSTFPGNLVYDASYEYYQLQYGFTKSFPLLHSAIVTRLFSLSELLTGSVNAGVAVYVLVQMIAAAALFAHILHRFHSDNLHPLLTGALAAYYAAFPVVHLLVTCTTRDVLFSLLLTTAFYAFYLLARDPDGFMRSWKNVILLAASLVFALLARNNNSGPLAILLLLFVCVLICLVFGRRHLRSSALFIASSLGLFVAVSAGLTALCQPLYDSPPASSMSILAQPIVRAHMLHSSEWPEEDRAEFESYFNMETLEYIPQNADPAKGNLLVRYANMRPFLAFWIKIGLRHPLCYLDAVLAGTRQMWFPASVIDGYTARGMFPAYEKNYFYFGQYIEEIGSRANLLPPVFSFYEDVGMNISFEKVPIVSMLFSIGFQFWLLLGCVFYVIYRKRLLLLWPLAVILLYTLLSAFVPLVLLRYFGALFLVMPMIAAFTLCPGLLCRQTGK